MRKFKNAERLLKDACKALGRDPESQVAAAPAIVI